MCLMTVKYTEESGGATIMENVTYLAQWSDGVELTGLLDAPLRLDAVRVVTIDFNRGITRLSAEHPSL